MGAFSLQPYLVKDWVGREASLSQERRTHAEGGRRRRERGSRRGERGIGTETNAFEEQNWEVNKERVGTGHSICCVAFLWLSVELRNSFAP